MEQEREAKEARLTAQKAERNRMTGATPLNAETQVAGASSTDTDADVRAIVQKEAVGRPVETGDVTERIDDDEPDAVFVEAPDRVRSNDVESVTATRENTAYDDEGKSQQIRHNQLELAGLICKKVYHRLA